MSHSLVYYFVQKLEIREAREPEALTSSSEISTKVSLPLALALALTELNQAAVRTYPPV